VHYWLSVHNPGSAWRWAHYSPKISSKSLCQQKAHFLILDPGWWHVFSLHALMFACWFITVNLCSITCDNPLWESLSYFTISLQKLNACFHACPFVLICKVFWCPPCTDFVIPEVLMDDGISRSTLMSNLSAISVTVIHLSSWTRELTHSTMYVINEVVRLPKWSSLMTPVLPLWNSSTHWYTFLCILVFPVLC